MPCIQITNQAATYTSSSECPSSGPFSSGAFASEAECLEACKLGACCQSNNTCVVKPQCQCQGNGQTFRGVGVLCSPNPCVNVCTDCCPSFLSTGGRKSIGLSVSLVWSTTCNGQQYSEAFSQVIPAYSIIGCPEGPYCSACVFVSGTPYGHFSIASPGSLCRMTVIVEIRASGGVCSAVASTEAIIRTSGSSSWLQCQGDRQFCDAPFQNLNSQQISTVSQPLTFSPANCLAGISFPVSNTVTSTGGNAVTVSGFIIVQSNPLP
jgi:hypothetical protein